MLAFGLACSSGETPNDDHHGTAGTGGGAMAGSTSAAGTSSGSAGKGSGSGGGAGTGSTSGGAGGSAGSGTGTGGTGAGTSGGAGAAAGGVGASGGSAGNASTAGATNGGAPAAGAGGAPGGAGGGGAGASPGAGAGGMAGGSSSTAAYSCNLVIGIDSTSEWFTSGFENQVPSDKWELIYHHPGYVEDWADTSDEVWTLAPTSACTMNATNPDRLIFNIYSETLTTKDTLVAAINKAITNFKAKYSRLQRIDILTMTRSPDNMPCVQGQNGSIVQQYVDDAAAAVVGAGPPAVIASPKFNAKDCSVFKDGGPHFTDAGKPIVAKIYGDYYSSEP
ncbi:MAG TPA: hypothetical protein VGQ57_00005 [Polyangiaceae bacterium]|nr:hypothetical protein [Polyangiaceae bacterium]